MMTVHGENTYGLEAVGSFATADWREPDAEHIDRWVANYHQAPLWSGAGPLPKLGDRVRINFNGLGTGTVVGYFVEHKWLGVHVRLDRRPRWWIKQNKDKGPYPGEALVFGSELDATYKPRKKASHAA